MQSHDVNPGQTVNAPFLGMSRNTLLYHSQIDCNPSHQGRRKTIFVADGSVSEVLKYGLATPFRRETETDTISFSFSYKVIWVQKHLADGNA